jgi:Bacterial conjugation TrbI-like protein
MNPRNVINFFKKPTGAFILFCLVLAVAFFAVKRFLPGATRPKPLTFSTKAVAAEARSETLQSYQNTNYSPMANPAPSTDAGDDFPPDAGERQDNHGEPKPEVLPISLFNETPGPEQTPLSKDYAPYGRLIPCELIVTVDSSSIQTPIIGLVTENVYYAGRLIIPAGTEVHSKAQTDRSRERIASGDNWTLVWQDGRELRLSGIALDREANPDGGSWGITDGSAGLRGQVLKTDDMAEIKLFAASFLSAAASALTENQQTVLGTEVLPTTQNAALAGAQNVMQAYAQQILDSIEQNGFYVRVPAGKQFYLYVTQTIDVSAATVGGTRFMPNDFASQTNSPTAPARNYFPPDAAALYRTGVMP